MAASGRPLGSGVVTLIVVDAVLVLIFLVMLLQFSRPGVAGSPPDGDGDPSPTVSTTSAGETVVFTLPSRNITCAIGGDATRCAIAEFEYAPPSIEGCEGRTGHEVELTADGARWLCTQGDPPGPAADEIDVLDYGASTSANGYTCESSEEGVTCRHEESDHSFSLARAGATLD
jgi:hypothetical protein